jgi:hypothetical protein
MFYNFKYVLMDMKPKCLQINSVIQVSDYILFSKSPSYHMHLLDFLDF